MISIPVEEADENSEIIMLKPDKNFGAELRLEMV